MQTGENEQGLRKILDLSRGISILLLILHFYWFGHRAYENWNLNAGWADRFIRLISYTGLFAHFHNSKLIALGFLIISLFGVRGARGEDLKFRSGLIYSGLGISLYFLSYFLAYLEIHPMLLATSYMAATCLGYILIIMGAGRLFRGIQCRTRSKDIFNLENESFPQEERLVENEYSVNLSARYRHGGQERQNWINIINPFRSLLVLGSPGSGKTRYIIRQVIAQHIQKGFAMFIYDFKFPDLSTEAFNHFLQSRSKYSSSPSFYVLNFDELSYSHRCNPLHPATMADLTDAAESARAIMLCINRNWILRQGDFFVESPINFLTAIIWFLCKYRKGKYCTLPHIIEFMQIEYDKLFTILRTEPEIEVLINPFISAFVNHAMEQLEGQVGGTKIAMSKLSSPNLYFVLSGNDFTLDINNPEESKIVCVGNNPQKQLVYNAVLSLLISRLIKLINKKEKLKSSLIFDEFPTIFLNGIDILVATARSNQVATTLVAQDLSQLRKDYGREQADVIMNITGNIVSGQVMGDTARQLSERFGRIMQPRETVSSNSTDTSFSQSHHLDPAIPPSKIASLSSGEFVGMVADDPVCPVELKAFHCRISEPDRSRNQGRGGPLQLPRIRNVNPVMVWQNYLRIKGEIQGIVEEELERILNTPGLPDLIIHRE
jgi:hypothetical protein